MKDFVKMTLAVVCGLFVAGFIGMILTFGFIGSLAAAGSVQQPLPKSGILKIDMSSLVIGEQDKEGDITSLIQGISTATLGIRKATEAISIAMTDPAVKCVYILPDGNATGMAHLEEFRAALSSFRASGKPIVAYTESPTSGGYYLASVADKIYMTSYQGATPQFNGVSTQLIFLKDLLDKLGVNMQLIRHGKYKSAGEMYIRNSASAENLQQNQEMVNSLWASLSAKIADGRGISVETLNSLIDNLALCTPEDFLANNMVDELLSFEELKNKLAVLAVVDSYKDVKMIDLKQYADAKVLPANAKKKIAIIYADGEIVDGNQPAEVAGDRFASIIAKVRNDDDIKAVVLRVSSPGGSVLASEKIKSELDLLGAQKPLVASYGEYAASGGYWISNNCAKIFSDETTITGSIGVFSLIPDVSKTLKDVAHVNMTTVGSNKHAGMLSLASPLSAEEHAYMQRSVEVIYDKFTSIVAQGRGLEQDYVDEIGQGRVWTGADGLRIGLVDEIGTLRDAIHWAAVAAEEPDMDKWGIVEYPRVLTMVEELLANFGGASTDEEILARSLKGARSQVNMARIPYVMEFKF